MLIILEGPDCAGKSTLAAQVAQRLRAKFPNDRVVELHRGPPKGHPLDEYVTPILSYRPGEGVHIVCDRWHLGEMIYPTILGRKTTYDASVSAYVEYFLRSRGAYVVILAPPASELVRRMSVRGDDMIDQLQMVAAWDHFRNMFAHGHIVERTTADEVIGNATGYEVRATLDTHFTTLIGHTSPLALILGDERNCRGACAHRQLHTPLGTAFMPYPATSGHYLFKALYFKPGWAFANACDVDDVVVMLRLLGSPPVVALGVNASKRLDSLRVSHASAPHPQYIRRFHHATATEYGALIEQIVGTERRELKWRPSSLTSADSGRTATF